MAETFDSSDRSGADIALFAVIFLGVILSAAGIIINSLGVLALGGFLVALGLVYFLIQTLLKN